MSDIIKNIKFYSRATLLSLILTYVFSYIITFKYSKFSNDFLVILFSGIFCSFCVLLISEIKKYSIAKRNTEDTLYSIFLDLYRGMTYEIEYANAQTANPNFFILGNIYSSGTPRKQYLCSKLRAIDYTLIKKSVFSKQFKEFKNNEITSIENLFASSEWYLAQAINMAGYYHTYEPALNVIKKMKAEEEIRKKGIESILSVLSSTFSDRYSWVKDKESIDSFRFDLNEWNERNAAVFNN